jgi:hypothetical protein
MFFMLSYSTVDTSTRRLLNLQAKTSKMLKLRDNPFNTNTTSLGTGFRVSRKVTFREEHEKFLSQDHLFAKTWNGINRFTTDIIEEQFLDPKFPTKNIRYYFLYGPKAAFVSTFQFEKWYIIINSD